MHAMLRLLAATDFPPVKRARLDTGESIRVADHCYGCTAGQGSSCGGALEAAGHAATASA